VRLCIFNMFTFNVAAKFARTTGNVLKDITVPTMRSDVIFLYMSFLFEYTMKYIYIYVGYIICHIIFILVFNSFGYCLDHENAAASTSFLYVTFSKLKRLYSIENVIISFMVVFFSLNVHDFKFAPPSSSFVFFGHAFNINLMCLSFILNCKRITIHVNKNDSSWCWRTLYISSIVTNCIIVSCFVEIKKYPCGAFF